jgi:zinc protease
VGLILGNAATDNPKTAEAWSITRATMKKFYEEGALEKEISAAKDYLTGSLALQLTSTDKIAAALVEMQHDRLGIDYLDRRNDLIRKVTPADMQLVIKTWFNPDGLFVSMVGKPDGVTPTETRALVRE